MSRRIFIACGEESGDKHGASLMAALKALDPELEVAGMGGDRMRKEGLVGLDSKAVSVVGLVEVAEKFPAILRAYRTLKAQLMAGSFDAVVLIDLPDFNMHLARVAKRLGLPVIYYISPQVWAWRSSRIKKIARVVDKMLVVFPFEVGLYKDAGVDVEYVGHPLAGTAVCPLTREQARASLGIEAGLCVVALLPGSRTGEVKRTLSTLLAAAGVVQRSLEGRRCAFLIPAADSIDDSMLASIMKEAPPGLDVRIVRGRMYEALRAADAAAVTSGTATLETALIGTPMVIIYRMSSFSFMVGKMLIGVKNVGLPNIIAGKELVPELLQEKATPERIAAELLSLISDESRRLEMTDGFEKIKELLGRGGAAEAAARAIDALIARSKGAGR